MRAPLGLILSFCSIMLSPLAAAQPRELDEAQTKSVVAALSAYIQKMYVFPEKRAQIADAIRADDAKGRYSVSSPKDLMERLNATLMMASNDKHLNVTFDPPRAEALAKPGDSVGSSYFDIEGLKWNQGYVRQEIFPGNIRYVRIKAFFWTDKVTPRVIDSTAQFLSGGSAVIIDLRGNGGGHSDAVQRMVSYLMPEKPTELMTFFDGQTGKSEVTYSAGKLPSPRIVGRPVYVLTDQGSVSAAEEFAYHVQLFKLGILVGQTTAGAANNNVLLPLPEGFVASVSTGRPIHPVSKKNWEGVGIVPDKAVPGPMALDAALFDALTALAQGGDAQTKADAAWELPAVRARLEPVRGEPEALKLLAGQYGERRVRWTGDRLTIQRGQGPILVLSPLADDVFTVEGMDSVRFRFDRKDPVAPVLVALFRDGRTQSSKRDGDPG